MLPSADGPSALAPALWIGCPGRPGRSGDLSSVGGSSTSATSPTPTSRTSYSSRAPFRTASGPLWHPGADAGAPFLATYPVQLGLVLAFGARWALALSLAPFTCSSRWRARGRCIGRWAEGPLGGRDRRRRSARLVGNDARVSCSTRSSFGGLGAPGGGARREARRLAFAARRRPPGGAGCDGGLGPGWRGPAPDGPGRGPARCGGCCGRPPVASWRWVSVGDRDAVAAPALLGAGGFSMTSRARGCPLHTGCRAQLFGLPAGAARWRTTPFPGGSSHLQRAGFWGQAVLSRTAPPSS